MFTIYCEKNQHNGLWCFDYVFTEEKHVFDEPLMHQASALIDAILISRDTEIPKTISITFDWLELPEPDAVLDYTQQEYGGSMYKSSQVLDWTEDYEKEVWLCPVLTYFFKEPPKKLYVYVNKEEDK
jgi:hypothetical protein